MDEEIQDGSKPTRKKCDDKVAVQARRLARLLYTHNPFYAISAALVFCGLRMSFDTRGATFETWALAGGLSAYTLLLAATAWALIRSGRVWDDARSLLLLIVLMFLGMSVSFDDRLASNAAQGIACYLAGLMFAILVSEALFAGLRIQLPAGYRMPYYLALSLFFLYPVALAPLVGSPGGRSTEWALFGFSPAAGLATLTLLPAVRRGPGYTSPNGTPWPWPWFPWTLFGLLGLGVLLRSFYLCVSLHFVAGSSNIFALYFLVPFLLAVNLVLLEGALASGNRKTRQWALAMPLALLFASMCTRQDDGLARRFLETFQIALGSSPLHLTLWAVVGFYAVAALRRVEHAREATIAALAALTFIGPETIDIGGPFELRGTPLLPIALGLLGWGIVRRDSARLLSAACCAVAGLSIDLAGTWFTAWRGAIPINLLVASVLGIGALVDDPLARWLRRAGAGLLAAGGVTATFAAPHYWDVPAWALEAYVAACIVLAAGYGWLVAGRMYFGSAAAIAAGWLLDSASQSYIALRRHLVGLDQLAWGAAFFVLALLISAMKAGLFSSRWRAMPSSDRAITSKQADDK